MPGSRWEQLANLRLLLAYQWIHPGKKLLFMGDEFGQDHEWDHNTPLDWHLTQYEPHQGIRNLVKDLNTLYRMHPALHHKDCEAEGFQWIDCTDRKNSTLSMLRRGSDPQDFVIAVLNFTAQPLYKYRIGVPQSCHYTEILNSDSTYYGGQNIGNVGGVEAKVAPMHGFPYSIELTLPPLGAIFLRPQDSPVHSL
jgi:1,4-alpha-glucan branching enzyme